MIFQISSQGRFLQRRAHPPFNKRCDPGSRLVWPWIRGPFSGSLSATGFPLTLPRLLFNISWMIEQSNAIHALSALAHDARLNVFRLLIRTGPEGLAAGEIGRSLCIPATALSFHLNRLREAGLVAKRRTGRHIVYAAEFKAMRDLLGFLSDNCCSESAFGCSDECPTSDSVTRRQGKRRRAAMP